MSISMSAADMKEKLQARLKPARYRHSLGVADTAAFLARRFGVAEEAAYVAGLLHDCARQFPNEDLPEEARRRGIPYGDIEAAMPLLLHGPVGAHLIAEEYGVEDAAIARAIARHTVGGADMSALDKIIYFADMIEPGRAYPEVEELRLFARQKSLDEMLLKGLSESILFVVQQGHMVHPDTVRARNEILLRQGKRA